jgi:type VI secretion system secreted protein VgrG
MARPDLPLAPLIGQPVTFTLTPQSTAPPLRIPGSRHCSAI